MFAPEKSSVTLKDRLSRLEDELELLLNLQEKRKQNPVPCSDTMRIGCDAQKCACTKGVCSNNVVTKSRTLDNSIQNGVNPLTNITKFLQNINLNLSKGTQAINKLANSATQQKLDECERNKCKVCAESHGNANIPVRSKSVSCLSKEDEDNLFRELREEKDKRLNAENRVKSLKDEVKQIQLLKEEVEARNEQLKAYVNELKVKLESTVYLLETKIQEMQNLNIQWPIKYEAVFKELQEEKAKRSEVERNYKNTYDSMMKCRVDIETHTNLQKTANWLKDQNENLLYLTQTLKVEIERNNQELLKKHEIAEDNINKIRNLTRLCGKMRDLLLTTKKKYVASKESLKENITTNQKLMNKYLEVQSSVGNLMTEGTQSKYEIKRLNELVRSTIYSNDALQSRIDEMTDVMKQQNSLIAQQSETITIKDEQMKLENENKNLMKRRLQELEGRNNHVNDKMNKEIFDRNISQLRLDLENAKDQNMIKEQIINGHMKTITQLKDISSKKEEEIYNLNRDLSETKRNLSIEKTTNEQLNSKIKALQSRKEELKQKLEDLEEDVDSKLSMEHTLRLEQLEKLILSKQKDWEDQRKIMVKEHEDALESSNRMVKEISDQSASHKMMSERHQQLVKDLTLQLEEKQNECQKATSDLHILQNELIASKESAEKAKLSFEEKLQSACESWQKTFQLLQQK